MKKTGIWKGEEEERNQQSGKKKRKEQTGLEDEKRSHRGGIIAEKISGLVGDKWGGALL